jgi:hypothetical protein
MSSPKIFEINPVASVKKRTSEQNMRRNEALARQKRAEFGGPVKPRLHIAGLFRAMDTLHARKRSDYLNSLLKRP